MEKFKEENITCKCGHNWVTEKKDSHPYLCHDCGYDSKTHKYNLKALNDWKMSQKPYTEEKNLNVIKRTFSKNVNEHELTWHRDKKDRVVKLLSETNWMIQFDNQLPIKMNINESITIPKNVYHRVIKGNGDLIVEITETDDVNEEEMIDEIKCWDNYHKEGTKISDKTGKRVNNCVKNKSVNEVVTSVEPEEGTKLTKLFNIFSNFIRGKETNELLNKIKTVDVFNGFKLKTSKASEGANGFDITIYDEKNKEDVGKLVAMIYKNKKTGLYNLQIRKAEIYPKYKGSGIMRTFYNDLNNWLKNNVPNFDKFTSDFIFLYNKETGKKIKDLISDLQQKKSTLSPEEIKKQEEVIEKLKGSAYDGFNMWEDLVKKGKASRLGPPENYKPPYPPQDGSYWYLKSGYALNEEVYETKKPLKESIWNINPMIMSIDKK